MEEWKEVYGFDVLYEISNQGRLRTRHYSDKGYQKDYRYIEPRENNKGYLNFNLRKRGLQKTVYVHRLVADAFIENPCGYSEVNHKDENKKNNTVDNLEWCEHVYNCNYGSRGRKIGERTSRAVICIEKNVVYDSLNKAAEAFGVGVTAISNCLNGRSKSCCGYTWAYKDV